MMMHDEWIENSEDVKEYQERYPYLYSFIAVIIFLLVGRLWYLQILKGNEFKKFSEQNQVKEEKNPAPRGMLLDRNGQLLVDSLPTFNVVVVPQYVASLEKTAEELSSVLKIKKEDIIEKVKLSRRQNGIFKPVRVKEDVTRDEVARVETMKIDLPGVKVEMGIKRNYLLDANGAQLFGYTGEISKSELPVFNQGRAADKRFKAGDYIGKSGLEKRWDADLRGIDGARFVEVDARGREVVSSEGLNIGGYPDATEYSPGRNLTLTIDKDLQEAAYASMLKNKRFGSAVALDPNNGEILAMMNAPSFDPNHFSTGIPYEIWADLINDPFKPLRNKVLQDHYSPGSTFKAIVATAALQEKIITTKSTFYCSGVLKFGRREYHCGAKYGHGPMNLMSAMEVSCNIFFQQLGIQLGIDRIAKYSRLLGLGQKTGITLDNEISGLIPDSVWKKNRLGEEWQPGENLSSAIGQGFVLVTPLQLANAYSAIGTNGLLYRPYIVKKIQDVEGKVYAEFAPKLIRDSKISETEPNGISPEVFETVKKALSGVFNGKRGTARGAKIPGIEAIGKTGTVQLFQLSKESVYANCDSLDLKRRHHGWLVASAPREKPMITVAVLTEHSCHGASSGPILKDIMLAYFKKYAPHLLQTEEEAKKITKRVEAEPGD